MSNIYFVNMTSKELGIGILNIWTTFILVNSFLKIKNIGTGKVKHIIKGKIIRHEGLD